MKLKELEIIRYFSAAGAEHELNHLIYTIDLDTLMHNYNLILRELSLNAQRLNIPDYNVSFELAGRYLRGLQMLK